jgi:uncharacterized membrane protein
VDLSVALTTPALRLAGAACAAIALGFALRRAPWWWLRQPGSVHVYAGTLVALLMLWQLRAGIGGGPWLHLLGATVLTLMFSWQLALVGCAVLVLGSAAAGHGDFVSAGLNFSLCGLLPVLISYRFARAVERWLAPNFFIYVFLSAFFGAALAVGAVLIATALVAAAGQGVPTDHLFDNYLPSGILLLFPEAFATGACLTLAVVYRPAWVVSFDDRRYLHGR